MTSQNPKPQPTPQTPKDMAKYLYEEYKQGKFTERQFRAYENAFAGGHETISLLRDLIAEEKQEQQTSQRKDVPKRNGSAFDFSRPEPQQKIVPAPVNEELSAPTGPSLNGSPR